MEESILNSTKKILGLDAGYTVFDQDIITHINSAFSTLTQLGIGPAGGFAIEDDNAEWANYLETETKMESVKTYVYLRVRQLFDPPATSYLVTAMEKQITELEWRLNSTREETDWVDPDPPPVEEEVP